MALSSTKLSIRRAERWALVALFLVAFLPRAVYPVSRPLQWYFRSAQFFQAVMEGNWAGTLFSEHPGVTVMWLSGGALWGWYGLQSLLGLHPPAPLETEGYAFADRVAVGVLPLALVISLGIVWGWFLLRRLFDSRVAWAAAALWALDPFHLTNSKVLHLDATLSILMLLSVLSLLLYLRRERKRHLLLSAVLGGLAILTKVSALFLFPFIALALLTARLRSISNSQCSIPNSQSPIRAFLIWAILAFFLIFLLWPALWVRPGECFNRVVREGILRHTGGTRDLPVLYRGRLGRYDPGPRFYLDVLLYRSTFLTLPFALVGLAAGLRRRGDRRAVGLLTVFGGSYFVQMSLGAWKDGRYMLPVLLVLDLLAGYGLAWWVGRLTAGRLRRGLLLGGLIALQAALVLVRHPYYGTHYNALLGGAQGAARVFPPADFGEGLDLAARYVDGLPGAEDLTVGTQFLANEMVAQYVRASVRDIAEVGNEVDVLVFGVQYTTRGRNFPRWGALWEATYKFREPEFVVSFDGIPYAWVHRPGAEPVLPHRTDIRLGESIRLVGYRLAQEEVSPGDSLLLTLYWRAESPVDRDYTVFVHLQEPGGGLVAQQDNPPVRGTRPTSGWEVGELVEDPYEIPLPADVPCGEYLLSTGLYDPATMERVPAFDAIGTRLPEDRVVLLSVRVIPVVPPWRWILSAAWLAVILVGVVGPRFGR